MPDLSDDHLPPPPPLPTGQSTPRRSSAGRYTTLPPEQAGSQLAHLLASSGAHVTSRTENGITGAVVVKRRPSILLALFLAFFFILPAVIYLAVGGKDASYPFSISITPEGSGSRLIVSGQGNGQRVAHNAVSQLP